MVGYSFSKPAEGTPMRLATLLSAARADDADWRSSGRSVAVERYLFETKRLPSVTRREIRKATLNREPTDVSAASQSPRSPSGISGRAGWSVFNTEFL